MVARYLSCPCLPATQWELKPWKQQSYTSEVPGRGQPLLLLPRVADPRAAPFPCGWAACRTRGARLDLARGSSVRSHTVSCIRDYLLFARVSDLCAQAKRGLCLGKLTLGVLLLTLKSTDLVWLNRKVVSG